jgi:hypothetical protein
MIPRHRITRATAAIVALRNHQERITTDPDLDIDPDLDLGIDLDLDIGVTQGRTRDGRAQCGTDDGDPARARRIGYGLTISPTPYGHRRCGPLECGAVSRGVGSDAVQLRSSAGARRRGEGTWASHG